MTPPRSNESRFAMLEADVKLNTAELTLVKANQKASEAKIESHHSENRGSIHDLKGGQQALLDQGAIAQHDITRLKTQMDMVIGSDHGKPGRLDQIQDSITSAVTEIKQMTQEQNKQSLVYEIAKVVLIGGVAAAAAHWGKT